MRLLTLFLFILFSTAVFAQQAQYTKPNYGFGVAVRGKAFAFVIIEDAYVYNYSIGTEFRFLDRHSFGIDYVFYRTSYEQDIYDTIKKEETGEGPNKHDTRKYINLDYRCYIGVNKWLVNSPFTPYVNAFMRLGIRNTHEQEGYILTSDESFNYHASFQQYGLSLGTLIGFGHDRFGVDLNLGVGKYYALVTEDIYSHDHPADHISNRPEERFSLFARANLYFYIY